MACRNATRDLQQLLTVAVCFSTILMACTSATSDEALFISSIYPARSADARLQSVSRHSSHIPIDRTSFTLKETSFCSYSDSNGPADSWLSRLSCPSRSNKYGAPGQLQAGPETTVGQCYIDSVGADRDNPTPDPLVSVWGFFTAICHMKGNEECGPDCSFVGTATGIIYELDIAYVTDSRDPTANYPLSYCDPYGGRKRRSGSSDTKRVAVPPRHLRRTSADKAAATNLNAAAAEYYDDDDAEYDSVGVKEPLPAKVWKGSALVFSGHMDIASLDGDVLPALGGWFEYYTPLAEGDWSYEDSNTLPQGARKINPFTYKFQLWKPAKEYEHEK